MMVCCTALAGLLALLFRPMLALSGSPLAWRLDRQTSRRAFNSTSRLRSFAHAFAGLNFALRREPNMRIHVAAAALATAAGIWLRIDLADWRWLIVAIALVLAAEALNTAIEQCSNAVTREFNPAIKAAKDVAAGAVLICATSAVLIGLSIFLPKIMQSIGPAQRRLPVLICGLAL
jgi:diacylglycerol kinase